MHRRAGCSDLGDVGKGRRERAGDWREREEGESWGAGEEGESRGRERWGEGKGRTGGVGAGGNGEKLESER